ncbi:MAG TPA: tetratricopeptide repeat protein [Bacteroidota bacterium]|nr:tetratricopeptide repeat protein [Bacteroidota bacterium]
MKFVIVSLLMFGGTCLLFGQSDRTLVREGNSLYKQDKYSDAETKYRKALEKNKDMKQGTFNLGDALYKEGRYDEAAEQYRIAEGKQTDAADKAQALHNLGNSLLQGKKIPESIAAYESALKLNPSDLDTKYNLEYAQALLKQQQQQQNQKNQNKDKKDQKDQQKQNQQNQNDQQKQDQKKQQQQDQAQAQQKKQQISKQDAERILQALNNQEKDVQKKLLKRAPARVQVDKDW